jgi:hypothetical protein
VRGLAQLLPGLWQVVTCSYLLDLDETETCAVLAKSLSGNPLMRGGVRQMEEVSLPRR